MAWTPDRMYVPNFTSTGAPMRQDILVPGFVPTGDVSVIGGFYENDLSGLNSAAIAASMSFTDYVGNAYTKAYVFGANPTRTFAIGFGFGQVVTALSPGGPTHYATAQESFGGSTGFGAFGGAFLGAPLVPLVGYGGAGASGSATAGGGVTTSVAVRAGDLVLVGAVTAQHGTITSLTGTQVAPAGSPPISGFFGQEGYINMTYLVAGSTGLVSASLVLGGIVPWALAIVAIGPVKRPGGGLSMLV